MKYRAIQRTAAAGLGSATVILLVVTALSYRSTTVLLDTVKWVAHTREVLAELGTVETDLSDARAGVAAYLMTYEGPYLQVYEAKVRETRAHLLKVRELTTDNPQQQGRVAVLEAAMASEFPFGDEDGTLTLTSKTFDSVREGLLASVAAQKTDAVSATLAGMRQEEERLLRDRVRARDLSSERTTRTLRSLAGLEIAILGYIYYLLRQALNERRKADALLRESEERFQLAVRGSNDGLWDWDLRTGELHLSTRSRKLLDLEDEGQGNAFEAALARLHPEDKERVLATLQAHFAGTDRVAGGGVPSPAEGRHVSLNPNARGAVV